MYQHINCSLYLQSDVAVKVKLQQKEGRNAKHILMKLN